MNHKLQVHILTLFLTLLVLSVFCIIAFSYFKTRSAILEFSKGTIERVSLTIREKIHCRIHDLEQIPKMAEGIITDFQEVSLKNRALIDFMLTAVQAYPHLHAFFIASPDGRFVEAADRLMFPHNHYLSNTPNPLPKGVEYLLREVDRTQNPPQETWVYKNKLFKTVAEEKIPSYFDPRELPWYLGAEQTKSMYWSEIYPYNRLGAEGIAVAYPMFRDKTLFAVSGATLPLVSIAELFSDLDKNTSVRAFVIASNGKIIIPADVPENEALVATAAFHQSFQEPETNFLMKVENVDYLIHSHLFPVAVENGWRIVIFAPIDSFFGTIFKARRETILISLALLLLSSLLVYYFSKRISKPIVQLVNEIDHIKHLNLQSEKRIVSHIQEISLLDSAIASMRAALRSFDRYVPKEIVRKLLEKGEEITLGGEKKQLTIFFSDIASFTPVAESTPLEIFMPVLKDYFDRLSKIILQEHGTIDKYIGDSIMAFWGAPVATPNPETHACTAALRCQASLVSFNKRQKELQKPEFYTRFGIHSGEVIVGNIGTEERMNYTVIGDAVNEAARLQTVNKLYHSTILISDEVRQKIGSEFLTRPLDNVLVKGKKQKIKIHELVAKYGAEATISPTPTQKQLCTLFAQAYEAYSRNDLKALPLFTSLHNLFPHDYPTQLYLSRLQEKSP